MNSDEDSDDNEEGKSKDTDKMDVENGDDNKKKDEPKSLSSLMDDDKSPATDKSLSPKYSNNKLLSSTPDERTLKKSKKKKKKHHHHHSRHGLFIILFYFLGGGGSSFKVGTAALYTPLGTTLTLTTIFLGLYRVFRKSQNECSTFYNLELITTGDGVKSFLDKNGILSIFL